MKLFISTESEKNASDIWSEIYNSTSQKLDFICSKDMNLEEKDNYGIEFKNIGIISIIASNRLKEWGLKERKLIKRKSKEADIRLYIDYEKFIKSSFEVQKLMYIENIMDSIDIVISRSKGDFKGEQLKQDILNALDLTYEDLKDI